MRPLQTHVVRPLTIQPPAIANAVRPKSYYTASTDYRIRSRGYGPSRDLLHGIPAGGSLTVESTLHEEDAAVQKAVLELMMPNLSTVKVASVRSHLQYTTRTPKRSTHTHSGSSKTRSNIRTRTTNMKSDGSDSEDVFGSSEREVMESCLQDQLSQVANLVVDQVGKRTGQQLDALQISYSGEVRDFSDVVLSTIRDEIRRLRMSQKRWRQEALAVKEDLSGGTVDVAALAKAVSEKVMREMQAITRAPPGDASAAASSLVLVKLEKQTAAYFKKLQSHVQTVLREVPAAAGSTSTDLSQLHSIVTEAVEKASAAQQEQLSTIVNDWMVDLERGRGKGMEKGVDMRALEDCVEGAVQASTTDLRRTILAELKKLGKGKGRTSEAGTSEADLSMLSGKVAGVFDLVEASHGRLEEMDEAVTGITTEQVATRTSLEAIQRLLQQQMIKIEVASTRASKAPAPTKVEPADTQALLELQTAVEELGRDVAAAGDVSKVAQEAMQAELVNVAQVVSESVAAAIKSHTSEALEEAMRTVQAQLESMTEASAAAAAAKPPPSPAAVVPAFSKEVFEAALTAVLTPRWAKLESELEKAALARQAVIEEQLLNMANSVAASVTSSLRAEMERLRVSPQTDAAVAAADADTEVVEVVELVGEEGEGEIRAAQPAASAHGAYATSDALEAFAEKTTDALIALRESLSQSSHTEAATPAEVDLTPMYKYIDSMLAFIKEELGAQEESITAKMASIADAVGTAVREQKPQASELPSTLTTTLESQAAALTRLEWQLAALKTDQNRDLNALVMRLQEVTAEFHKAATPAAAPDNSAWQSTLATRLGTIETSIRARDMDLLAAVRASAVDDAVKAQLVSISDALKSLPNSQRESLTGVLREIVTSTAQEQASRVDALSFRLSALQDSMAAQTAALRVLQPALVLAGLTPPERQQQARLRIDAHNALAELETHVKVFSAPGAADAAALAKLQTTLARLAALQAEEDALLRAAADRPTTTSTTMITSEHVTLPAAERPAAATPGVNAAELQSVVRLEVQAAQAALQRSIEGLPTGAAPQTMPKEVAAMLDTLLQKMTEVHEGVEEVLTLADLQQLMDAVTDKLAAEQEEATSRVEQIVTEAGQRSVTEVKAAIEGAMKAGMGSGLEERLVPPLKNALESTLQARFQAQAGDIQKAVTTLSEHVTGVVGKVEEAMRGWEIKAAAAAAAAPSTAAVPEQFTTATVFATPVRATVPWWWMFVNPLLVTGLVLSSLYYLFTCLLLAFVPLPMTATTNSGADAAYPTSTFAASSSSASASLSSGSSSRLNWVVEGDEDSASQRRMRHGSRYVDRYM